MRTRRFPRLRCATLLLALSAGCAQPDAAPGDRAEVNPAPYAPPNASELEFRRSSRYLAMRDGVKIAVDVYLPEGTGDAAELPTILHQTRYWRSVALRWPVGAFLDAPDETVRTFLAAGYAWVSVDARGSGASFGRRPYPWSRDEILDGAEIVDWIVAQPWSNGRVGSFGTSYDGTTAEFLASNGHPAVRAIAPRFALFDVYTDIAFPGGVQLTWFTETWSAFNRDLDRNAVPPDLLRLIGFPGRLLVAGVRPVDGDADSTLLAAAVRDHATNWDPQASAADVVYRDDVDADGATLDAFSPHRVADRVSASGAAVYSFSGWFDGGYASAAIRRQRTLESDENRLILGPWTHGGEHQVRGGHSEPTRFDHVGELLKFFDPHLRGVDSGIADEQPVHYFTMVEERWKSADHWPPPAHMQDLYFKEGGALEPLPPADGEAFDTYVVDMNHGTGDASRWNSLMGWPVDYPDRAAADATLLTYTSAPLADPVEVTGHPLLTLHVASSAEDGAFFAYLEDVGPDGSVTYVTEGVLRALHRGKGEPGARAGHAPRRSFERAAGAPMVPGAVTELVFELQPTSYRFDPGHAIRIALAGADRDHFARIPARGTPTWRIHRDRPGASRITLPVIAPGG